MIRPLIAQHRSKGDVMKRILLMIPLTLSGCSQDREERRETVKTCLLAPFVLAADMLLPAPSDPKDETQNMIDRQNSMQPGGYTVTKHLSGDNPDVR
jgi:hypothetical protein